MYTAYLAYYMSSKIQIQLYSKQRRARRANLHLWQTHDETESSVVCISVFSADVLCTHERNRQILIEKSKKKK